MQLTRLDLFGFKSFANRQVLHFDKGITGIVGPNGCGKSNIVDAVKWVLGEQKTKNLRSDKMESVIFNGTKSKRKSNFAEVSLTFENTRNLLPTEYSTVKITRKLYRSGDSEYQINGVTCRLKDIQNLFMDTGISSDSYAIIELGMVDEILTNKNNERRRFFEEAAGISKYKIRKKQTLKRLKDTDDDLERVEDLLFEINKNLKSLEKQARRTQRYFEIKEQYKLVSSQFSFLSMRDIREKQNQLKILEENLSDEVLKVQAGLSLHEARIQDLRKELLDNEKKLSEAQADLNKQLAKIRSIETEKSIKHERLKYLQQRELAVQNQIENEKTQSSQNQSAIMQLRETEMRQRQEMEGKKSVEQDLTVKVEAFKKTFEEQNLLALSTSEQSKASQQEVQDLIRELDIKKVKIQGLESELNRANEDRTRRETDLDAFSEKTQELETAVQKLEHEVKDLESKRKEHQEQIQGMDEKTGTLKDRVYKSNRLLDAKQNEFNLTKSLVENLEGFPASVKFLKKNAKWIKDAPLLSDVFAVPEDYKAALENYLDNYLSYYVVPSRKDALLSVHMLAEAAKGRANFFILDELESYQQQNPLLFTQAKYALDVVDFSPEYKKLAAYLLDKVYIVANEGEIPEEIPENSIFLNKNGNMTRRRFIMGGGSLGLFEGKRLGRAKNLEKLDKEIKKLQSQLSKEKGELEDAQKEFERLKQKDFGTALNQASKALSGKQRDLSVLQTREKEYQEFLARVGQRSDALLDELESLRKSIDELDPQIARKREEALQMRSKEAQQQADMQETRELLDRANAEFNEAHIQYIHLQNQLQNTLQQIETREDSINRYTENHEKHLEELRQVEQDIENLISSNLQDDETIVRLYRERKEKEERVGKWEESVGMTKNSIHQVEKNSSGDRKKREDMLQRQASLKEQSTEVRIELNSLKERMSVEFQVDLGQLDEESLFKRAIRSYDLTKLEQSMLSLRHKIQNFGEINPMAVEAFQEIKERHDFITVQKNDLLEAKQSLLSTIEEIDTTAKAKFLETFYEVRENFQRVFKSLFYEEDNCDLILTDPEHPLESEINIIARPKGKRPLTIKQLSGGEKTLTAVALLFSIYLIKPAPFCIFDEVDAPLDDANIDKFNNIIKDFSSDSQFIIVTHNKRTMLAAPVLYGVTMNPPGISNVVPSSFKELDLV
ncbi:MAG: chromosome segregation protein SMC [Bacteroidia bacterium]|nr:chromosome segregation protein SMC [Bacteroidia bacterium]